VTTICLLLLNFLLFETTAKKLDQSPPIPTVVATMLLMYFLKEQIYLRALCRPYIL